MTLLTPALFRLREGVLFLRATALTLHPSSRRKPGSISGLLGAWDRAERCGRMDPGFRRDDDKKKPVIFLSITRAITGPPASPAPPLCAAGSGRRGGWRGRRKGGGNGPAAPPPAAPCGKGRPPVAPSEVRDRPTAA